MNILIVGATSAIAQATILECLKSYGADDVEFTLVARHQQRLEHLKQDLESRSVKKISLVVQDLTDLSALVACIQNAWSENNGFDLAVLAHGTLPNQKDIQLSADETLAAYTINALSHITIMTSLAELMEKRGAGTIVIIGSVAGDRGRQSNYIYGSAKGAVAIFAQGLRNRLFKSGVHVLTVKPGFVDTPMTDGFDKTGPLWSKPEAIAGSILKAVIKKKNVIYVPGFWFVIMTIIKSVPEFIFKRLSL